MKQGFTKIAIVLDRSGSMGVCKQATIDGVNEFVNLQKQEPGDCSLRIAQFDHEYDIIYDGGLGSTPTFDDKSYVPRGMTALRDAIGRTIDDLGNELDKLPEDDRPEHVMVAIITDGIENNSHIYNKAQIAEKIKQQREKYSWNFVFIGANQDAVLTAQDYAIPASGALTNTTSAIGTRNTYAAMSNYAGAVRGGICDPLFSQAERDAAMQ